MSDHGRSDIPHSHPFGARARLFARRAAAVIVAVVALTLTLAAAGVIAVAALAVAAIGAIGVGFLWLVGRFAGPRMRARRNTSDEDGTLDARKGPRGWTVEARRFSF